MKKILSIFTVIIFLSFCGCSVPVMNNGENDTQTLTIITTNFPPYDFVRSIVGDAENVEVSMLLPPGADSHSFEPSPQQIISIQGCDLFIYTGGEGDKWVDSILSSMGEAAPTTLRLLDCVDAVEEEIVEGMQSEPDEHGEHDDDDGHSDEEDFDEHVWTSPKNAAKICTEICDVLSKIDSANSDLYNKNTSDYIRELEQLDLDIRKIVDNSTHKLLLFGDRFAFRYFADEYGLSYYAAFPGCSTETDASAATIAFLIEKAGAQQIPVILKMELSSDKIANAIANAVGGEVMVLHSCHNITKDELAQGVSYLSLMQGNLAVLEKVLT